MFAHKMLLGLLWCASACLAVQTDSEVYAGPGSTPVQPLDVEDKAALGEDGIPARKARVLPQARTYTSTTTHSTLTTTTAHPNGTAVGLIFDIESAEMKFMDEYLRDIAHDTLISTIITAGGGVITVTDIARAQLVDRALQPSKYDNGITATIIFGPAVTGTTYATLIARIKKAIDSQTFLVGVLARGKRTYVGVREYPTKISVVAEVTTAAPNATGPAAATTGYPLMNGAALLCAGKTTWGLLFTSLVLATVLHMF